MPTFPYKPRAGETTEPHAEVMQAQHLAVYQEDDCVRRLKRPDRVRSSGIPIQLTEKTVEIRDGSLEYPIRLPALQKSNLLAVPYLVGMLADGTLVAWAFGQHTCNKKIAIKDGMATIVADYYSDLIDGNVCTEDICENLDGMIGFKETIEHCPGQPDQIRIQLVKAPHCCCPDSTGDDCPSCPEIDAMEPIP